MVYVNKIYDAIYKTDRSSFKQPRQKMWGIFVAGEQKSGVNKWNLVYQDNDFEGAKDFFNEWLQNPDIDDKTELAGSDNIMMVEILPINSATRV